MPFLKNRRLFSLVPFIALPLAAAGAFAGCDQSGSTDTDAEAGQAVADLGDSVPDEAIPAPPSTDPCGIGPACDPSISAANYPISPSLVLTRNTESLPGQPDAPILDNIFPLDKVLNQLISQAGVPESADEWLQRLWDTQNKSLGMFNESFAPHCSDNSQTVNGFSIDCERDEGQLANKNTITTDFFPIAVFNRFDLAPVDGGHCGEYRIIYAMNEPTNAGVTGRNFIIFEGQLPNPAPDCGIESCRPVVDFWSNLSTLTTQSAIAKHLHKFYFDGLPGFKPVVEIHHYGFVEGKDPGGGGYGNSGGQIRTNQFVNGPTTSWMLKEFKLDVQCDGNCKLFANPVSVKNNPFFNLFDVTSTMPEAPPFQTHFTDPGGSQVASLVTQHTNPITNLNLIAMNIDDKFNAGQSRSNDLLEDYQAQFQPGANTFRSDIQSEVALASSTLTEEEVIDRAATQACMGCHELSNSKPIGDGLIWPNSNKFTHVNEDGTKSQALDCVFLPHRQAVGIGFLQNCGTNPDPIVPKIELCTTFTDPGYGGGKKVSADGSAAATLAPAAGFGAHKATAPGMVKTIGGGSQVN